MRIEIAGIAAEVHCRYPSNEAFLKDYETDRAPAFSVAPTESDLARMQAEYDRTADAEGRSRCVYSAEILENTAIHALLAEKLTEHDVLLLHASALCMDGEAYVFAAPSGTGKSTHARLWRETFGARVRMINDDKPLLRIAEDGVTVYGSPWNGKQRLGSNICAPLRAIAFLSRGERTDVLPLSRADAFPLLMRQSFRSDVPETMAHITELETRLLCMTAFYRLRCNTEPDAATAAWEAMCNR